MKYDVFQLPYRLTGDSKVDAVYTQRNLDAMAGAISQIQKYENTSGLVSNSLLQNTVADERLGASIVGFTRDSVAYKQDGTQVLANLPRYEYSRCAAPMWEDTFDINSLAQYTSGGDTPATWVTSGGVLSSTNETGATLIKKDIILQDCEIEVTCDLSQDGGIVARYQDNKNYYLLSMYDDASPGATYNLKLWKRVSGAWTSIISADVAWARGTAKVIKFVLNGSHLEAWFDGVKYISVTDTAFTTGNVGLRNGGAIPATRFLDFKVYQASQGIMVEEGTTNIVTKSDPTLLTDFPVNSGVTITSGIASFLQGGAYFIDNSIARFAYMTPALQPNTTYTISAYVRMDDGLAPNPSNASTVGDFGLVGEGGLISTNPTVISCGSGLYRVSATFAVDATVANSNTGVVKYTTQSTRGFKVSGYQIEAKSYITSYVATSGATVTRASETCILPTANVFTKGNWTVEKTFTPTSKQDTSPANRLWILYIDANNRYGLHVNTNGYIEAYVLSGGIAYMITSSIIPQIGSSYSVNFSGDGTNIRLCVNGVQIGSDLAYIEPIGTLPINMYIGSNQQGTEQADSIIDDLRISSKARTYKEHYDAWKSGIPLEVDDITTLKQSFNGTLRPTVRSRTKEEDIPITADKIVTVIDDRDIDITYTPIPTPPGADMNPTGVWYQWYGSMYYYNKTYTVGDGALGQTQSLEYIFVGSSISIIGGVWADSGKIDVYLDNVFKATVDTYNPYTGASDWNTGRAELYKIENLTYTTHTIKIVVRTDKNVSSTAYKFYFDGFRIGKGLSVKALDILVVDQYVNVTTNANGYGELNVGGYEPGGNSGNYLILCLTGARLYGNPNPNSTTTPKPKVGVKGQYLYVWDAPINSTVQIEFSALLMTK